jgi:hypothetical protein
MLLGLAVLDDLMVFALHIDQCDYVLQTRASRTASTKATPSTRTT